MKQKFSIVLDRRLFRRLMLESLRQGKPVSELIGDAMESHLWPSSGRPRETGLIVDATWDSMPIDRESLKESMQSEASLLDS